MEGEAGRMVDSTKSWKYTNGNILSHGNTRNGLLEETVLSLLSWRRGTLRVEVSLTWRLGGHNGNGELGNGHSKHKSGVNSLICK